MLLKLICITFFVTSKAQLQCPQGWTVFSQSAGKHYNKPIETIINNNRQSYHNLNPGYKFGYLAYNETLGRHADAYAKTCNIDYLLEHQQEGSNNYNVSTLDLHGPAYFWHVTSDLDCTSDWEFVINAFFDIVGFDKLEKRCYVAQLKAFGCAFNCFKGALTQPDKIDKGNIACSKSNNTDAENNNMYIRSYVCNYEMNCSSPQDVSEKCMDFCGL